MSRPRAHHLAHRNEMQRCKCMNAKKAHIKHHVKALKINIRFINQLLSFYCNNACESKINIDINILCEHMAMLSVRLTKRHHTNTVELYFLFLHTFIIYKPFNKRKTS